MTKYRWDQQISGLSTRVRVSQEEGSDCLTADLEASSERGIFRAQRASAGVRQRREELRVARRPPTWRLAWHATLRELCGVHSPGTPSAQRQNVILIHSLQLLFSSISVTIITLIIKKLKTRLPFRHRIYDINYAYSKRLSISKKELLGMM